MQIRKIVLINPNFRHIIPLIFKLKMSVTLPLGIAYIASYLECRGYDVKIIDAYIENLSYVQILQQIKIFQPDVVGFSTNVTGTMILCADLAKKIRELNPNIITVVGGIIPTFMPQETLQTFPVFDFLIRYEGEITFYSLLEALKNNINLRDIKGLVYRNENKEIVINQKREFIEDLDCLPLPARHLLPNDLYKFRGRKTTIIISAKGCLGRCVFCIIQALYGEKVRRRNVKNVVDEMEECYHNYGYTKFNFIDSTFTYDRAYTLSLMEEIIKRNLNRKIVWNCVTRVDRIDRELLKEMKIAGCIRIDVGVETTSEAELSQYNKGITLSQIEESCNLIKKTGISVGVFLIMNQYLDPKELRRGIDEACDFILKISPDDMRLSSLVVLPNTEMYHLFYKNIKRNDYQLFFNDYYIGSKYLSKKQINRYINKIYVYFHFYIYLHKLFKKINEILFKKLPLK